MDDLSLREQYEKHGFVRRPGFVSTQAMETVEPALRRFHERWLVECREHYEDGVINSAYLTREGSLSREDRLALFQFVGSRTLRELLSAVLPGSCMFVGTQLFFDPLKPGQANYWHRDIQYRDMSIEDQQRFLRSSNVLHIRVAFRPERGVELIPGTHRRWDDAEEFDVRMAQNGHRVHDDLPKGVTVSLERGDGVLFSAGMIHRGLYGGDRFAFDLLFADADEETAKVVPVDCLPSDEELARLEWPEPFALTRQLLSG